MFYRKDENGIARLFTVYIDQIMAGYNKQSAASCAAMLEGAIHWIYTNVLSIKSITVQSDQAKCYQSNALRVRIAALNMFLPIPIVRYIHTGVQAGKCLIDAHFACAQRYVKLTPRGPLQRNTVGVSAASTPSLHVVA